MSSTNDSGLLPDRQEIARFYDTLFRYASNGFILMRAFSGGPFGRWSAVPAHERDRVVGAACRLATQCGLKPSDAVFCPPVATFRNDSSASELNVAQGVALSVECDEWPLKALEVLRAVLGDPTAVVASGGRWPNPRTGEIEDKLHLHWRIEPRLWTRELVDLLKEARRLACYLAGSDGSAVPPCHPMRWPGSWHRKAEPRLVRIVGGDPEHELDLDRAYADLRFAVRGITGGEAVAVARSQPADQLEAHSIEDVAHALWVIPNDDLDWEDWNKVGMATWGATGGSEQGLALFRLWSLKSRKRPKHAKDSSPEERWVNYRRHPPGRIGMGTLNHLARDYSEGPDWFVVEAGEVIA